MASAHEANRHLRVLVTGATGFTGWHATSRLRAEGHTVRALVRDPEKARKHLGPLGLSDADWVVGDMTDAGAVAKALEGCEAVIHAAASVSVTKAAGASGADPFAQNVEGVRCVVGGACEREVETVIFVSSLTAILDPRAPEATRGDSPLVEAGSRYGRSKAESDRYVRSLQEAGAPVCIVYPSAIIGPNDPGRSESMSAFRGFLQFMIDSSGGTQFVDGRDLGTLLERMLVRRMRGRHIAAGNYLPWDELRRTIEQVTGAHIGKFKAPGAVLRTAGRIADVAGRISGRPLLITREAMEIATRWRAVADSPSVAEVGVQWRAPSETLADVYQWFAQVGAVPAKRVPLLAEDRPSGAARP